MPTARLSLKFGGYLTKERRNALDIMRQFLVIGATSVIRRAKTKLDSVDPHIVALLAT